MEFKEKRRGALRAPLPGLVILPFNSSLYCQATDQAIVERFLGYLASLPPVLGLGFGAFGKWSAEVDTLIGQMADIASEVPPQRVSPSTPF